MAIFDSLGRAYNRPTLLSVLGISFVMNKPKENLSVQGQIRECERVAYRQICNAYDPEQWRNSWEPIRDILWRPTMDRVYWNVLDRVKGPAAYGYD